MRSNDSDPSDWSRLGNALAQIAVPEQADFLNQVGISISETLLYSATAFYCGGYPASAYLILKSKTKPPTQDDTYQSCLDLLSHPAFPSSPVVKNLAAALQNGDQESVKAIVQSAEIAATNALQIGPSEWIPARLFEQLTKRFLATNIRSVLPDGWSEFWTPLVSSFIRRPHPSWEFFPSQIAAISGGLLHLTDTFSMQMPTGAGKTALCETLLYWHSKVDTENVSVMLVPYRSLASELRSTVVRRLNNMGISARCAYGGTVPTGDEVRNLEGTRVIVSTPEALSGILSADAKFFRRISLVICDEGHLLDNGARGVGLELLLARMKAREGGAPRFVFVSAIVPNIDEINSWLGGQPDSVVRSDYRPAIAEFATLQRETNKTNSAISLRMHPHEPPPTTYDINGFLKQEDFQWLNRKSNRLNKYPFSTTKTQAIATARKLMPLGSVAVFAANKRGGQGAVGLTEELLEQLDYELPLPRPIDHSAPPKIASTVEYLRSEYGADWIGTRALAAGAILHHGDIPQETREVVESLLRQGDVRLTICTNTLAEGVNLPIRTIVLYSVQRRTMSGQSVALLSRDIKNLVGRAGRAGATTKGLVICANEKQWPLIEQVAKQAPGEPVHGSLITLLNNLKLSLALESSTISNQALESHSNLHALTDGIDATLIDLATEEIGEAELRNLAISLAEKTLASSQLDEEAKKLLHEVFSLRAERVLGIRASGRLSWIRETGARPRLLDLVEKGLLPRRATWDDVTDAADPSLISAILAWVWEQAELQDSIRDVYQLTPEDDIGPAQQSFFASVSAWLAGETFEQIASQSNLALDDFLSVYTTTIAFKLQTTVEQGIALLSRLLDSQECSMSSVVADFPEHLRFGVSTPAGRMLSAGGVRHRRASVLLGLEPTVQVLSWIGTYAVFHSAQQEIGRDRDKWRSRLGELVFNNTLQDLASFTGEEI
ncbi:DEAD/DEAH box helicase [Corallococcus exiguus]|uniref:DEAD/DEAH box helicase n=1 Tax=Corallococcus exiguus TaxID=83462 RepID=UPI001C27B596|nr:DEAD/DEAH box helicase [Corallococcus exiguus]